MSFPVQTLVVQAAAKKNHKIGPLDALVSLVNPDGSAFTGGGSSYTLPAATADALGGVKLQVFKETIGNANENIAVAAAAAPTKAEYDSLVASYNALAKQFNQLVSGLSSSGVIKLPDKK